MEWKPAFYHMNLFNSYTLKTSFKIHYVEIK